MTDTCFLKDGDQLLFVKTAQEQIRGALRDFGFDEVRFAGADAVSGDYRKRFLQWLEEGHHGQMEWMQRTAAKRLCPQDVLEGVLSLILVGVNYLPADETARHQKTWAKFSLYSDYHDTLRAGLVRAGNLLEERLGLGPRDYRYYVDTGPVLERGWAARSGMGWQGKNGMLISRRHGNWLFLGAILTRYPFEPDPPLTTVFKGSAQQNKTNRLQPEVGALCGSCQRCIFECPTDAIKAEGLVDARLCISYQTIENKGIIPVHLRPGIGGRIFGCDICLDICPWNKFAQAGSSQLLNSRHDLAKLTIPEVLRLSKDEFSKIFAKTAVKRLKWRGLLRNACVAAGNARVLGWNENEVESVRMSLLGLAACEEPLVRAHAVWAVRRLWPDCAREWLEAPRERETNPEVIREYDSL